MAPDSRATDGRRSVCKECRETYDRERYRAKRDRILGQQRGYRQTNRGVRWLADYQRRARRYGFDPVGEVVTPEAIIEHWGDRCFYNSEHPFEQADHFIAVAAGGHHVLDNLVPCCQRCNAKKRWEIDEAAIRLSRSTRVATAISTPPSAPRPT
jgi:5-methylcytosine-specific restriction endonuclease McrA